MFFLLFYINKNIIIKRGFMKKYIILLLCLMITIVGCKKEIVRIRKQYEADIAKREGYIANIEKEIRQLRNALKKTDDIEYIHILVVSKNPVSSYIGKNTAPSYYISSDWKEEIMYSIEVYECNKDNFAFARTLKRKLTGYSATEKTGIKTTKTKSQLLQDILVLIKEFGITAIKLEKGATVSTTAIKQKYPDIEIRK